MSERTVRRCDGCGKISEAAQTEAGWISIKGEIESVTRYKGQSTGIDFDYDYSKVYTTDPDLCSFRCLVEWFRLHTNTSIDESFDS